MHPPDGDDSLDYQLVEPGEETRAPSSQPTQACGRKRKSGEAPESPNARAKGSLATSRASEIDLSPMLRLSPSRLKEPPKPAPNVGQKGHSIGNSACLFESKASKLANLKSNDEASDVMIRSNGKPAAAHTEPLGAANAAVAAPTRKRKAEKASLGEGESDQEDVIVVDSKQSSGCANALVNREASAAAFLKVQKDDGTILECPFEGPQEKIEAAAKNLRFAGVVSLGSNHRPPVSLAQHSVIIERRDVWRLEPGEWLNDNLINFWFWWLTSKAHPSKIPFYCFHSQFFTALMNRGPYLASKFVKQNINLFEKELLLIPINMNKHWSLCAIINAGRIRESAKDGSKACALLMDSLGTHPKEAIGEKLREFFGLQDELWNCENSNEQVGPFDSKDRFPMLSVKVPRQKNGNDCGVCVCMNALQLWLHWNRPSGQNGTLSVNDLFAPTNIFQYNMSDIAQLRQEVLALIQALAELRSGGLLRHGSGALAPVRCGKVLNNREVVEVARAGPTGSARTASVNAVSLKGLNQDVVHAVLPNFVSTPFCNLLVRAVRVAVNSEVPAMAKAERQKKMWFNRSMSAANGDPSKLWKLVDNEELATHLFDLMHRDMEGPASHSFHPVSYKPSRKFQEMLVILNIVESFGGESEHCLKDCQDDLGDILRRLLDRLKEGWLSNLADKAILFWAKKMEAYAGESVSNKKAIASVSSSGVDKCCLEEESSLGQANAKAKQPSHGSSTLETKMNFHAAENLGAASPLATNDDENGTDDRKPAASSSKVSCQLIGSVNLCPPKATVPDCDDAKFLAKAPLEGRRVQKANTGSSAGKEDSSSNHAHAGELDWSTTADDVANTAAVSVTIARPVFNMDKGIGEGGTPTKDPKPSASNIASPLATSDLSMTDKTVSVQERPAKPCNPEEKSSPRARVDNVSPAADDSTSEADGDKRLCCKCGKRKDRMEFTKNQRNLIEKEGKEGMCWCCWEDHSKREHLRRQAERAQQLAIAVEDKVAADWEDHGQKYCRTADKKHMMRPWSCDNPLSEPRRERLLQRLKDVDSAPNGYYSYLGSAKKKRRCAGLLVVEGIQAVKTNDCETWTVAYATYPNAEVDEHQVNDGFLATILTERVHKMARECVIDDGHRDKWLVVGDQGLGANDDASGSWKFFWADNTIMLEDGRPRACGGADFTTACGARLTVDNFEEFFEDAREKTKIGFQEFPPELEERMAKRHEARVTSFFNIRSGAAMQASDEYEYCFPLVPLAFHKASVYGCLPDSFGSVVACHGDPLVRNKAEKAREALNKKLTNPEGALPEAYFKDKKPRMKCDEEAILRNVIRKHLKLVPRKMKWEPNEFLEPKRMLTVARLEGSKHCVGVLGDLLLESQASRPYALQLNEANLDLICGGKGCYKGVIWAYECRTKEEDVAAIARNKAIMDQKNK